MKLFNNPKIALQVAVGSAILLIILLVIYFTYDKEQVGVQLSNTGQPEEQGMFPIKLGKFGPEVKALQTHLATKYGATFPKFGIDGKFGPETLANVKKYLNKDTVSQEYYSKIMSS